ncbi:MAG: hypothetical protein LC776_19685 [Acidobacteria bacterium]|nr:hypothetical protein [Acidobacteriota bacterium]
MGSFNDSSLAEIAARMRELAAGMSNPADIAAIKKYARELERIAQAEDTRLPRRSP